MFYPERKKKDTAAATSKSVVLSNQQIIVIIIKDNHQLENIKKNKKSVNMGRIVNGIHSVLWYFFFGVF